MHCYLFVEFCTEWPENLETEKTIDRHFPLQITSSDYCHSSPTLRVSRIRIVTVHGRVKELSRIYHPDKHKDALRKKEAEVLFNKTKKAYEVLSVLHKRAIYDSLRTKGLETEGWEVVQRTKMIREEYKRIVQVNEERRLHKRTNPSSSARVSVDLSELFTNYEDEYQEY